MDIIQLEEAFNNAKEAKSDICVGVTIPGQENPEFIINRFNSLDNKLSYYKDNYNKDGSHKFAPGVKIVSVTSIEFICQYENQQ